MPFSEEGLGDRIFLPYKNPSANVPPFDYLREYLRERGVEAKTIDFWDGAKDSADTIVSFDYPPTGIYRTLYFLRRIFGKKSMFAADAGKLKRVLKTFRKRILFQWESPVNNPWMYKAVNDFHRFYDKIYSIPDFAGAERFNYPQNFNSWSREYFDGPHQLFMVFMNSPKRAKGFFQKELYAKREKVAEFFAKNGEIDIYGGGWERHKNAAIRGAAKGFAGNKPETFSRYKFALCFENAVWPGYLTEKIFDCLFVGTIPVYLGDPEIEKRIPPDCFVDIRKFNNYIELRQFLRSLSSDDLRNYREAARAYLDSKAFKKFTKEYFSETVLKALN